MKPIVANKYSMKWNHINIHLYQDGWKMAIKEAKRLSSFSLNCEVVAGEVKIEKDRVVGVAQCGNRWQHVADAVNATGWKQQILSKKQTNKRKKLLDLKVET